jgi:hypothetical protein
LSQTKRLPRPMPVSVYEDPIRTACILRS